MTAAGLVAGMEGLPKELHTSVVSTEPLAHVSTPTPPMPGQVVALLVHL